MPNSKNSNQKQKNFVMRDCKYCGELVKCNINSAAAQDSNGISAVCNNCSSSQISMYKRWEEQLG